jgi:hypothetical protein
MARNTEKVTIKVDADTGSADRELKGLETRLDDLTEKAVIPIDLDADPAEAALRAMASRVDEVTSEVEGMKSAMASIKGGLSVPIDDAKIEDVVVGLRNIGLTFDQIEGKAREFAGELQRAEGVRLDALDSGLTRVGGSLEHVRSESDQSRSVLANLAGNAAQDLGQLGGVVGSLGVGIGQLAEYAVDGNIRLSNLARVAGPMAALSVATLAVTNAMQNLAATKAFDAQQVKDFTKAMDDLGNTSAALRDSFDGVFEARVDDNSFLGQLLHKEKTENLADDLGAVGVSLHDLDSVIRSGASTRADFDLLPGIVDLDKVLQAAGLSVDDYKAIMDGVFEATKNWTEGTKGATAAAEFFAPSLADINDELRAMEIKDDPLSVLNDGLFETGGHMVDLRAIWHDVVNDLRDGHADFDTTAENVNVLAAAMNLTTPEVEALAIAQGKGAKEAEAMSKATADAADAASDAVVDFQELGRVVGGVEWQTASIQATSDAMGTFFGDAERAKDGVAGLQGALDDLEAAHADAGTLLPDLSTGEGRQFWDALKELGSSLIPDIQQAFDDSRGSVDTFNQKMQGLYLRTLAQLSNQLGISTEDAELLLRQIGFVPENFSTQYDLIGDQLAIQQLQLLQGIIDDLPAEVQARIAYQVSVGDYQGAVQTVVTYGQKHPVVLPSSVNTSGAQADVNAFQSKQTNNPIILPATLRVTRTVGVTGGYVKTGPTAATLSAVPQSALLSEDGVDLLDAPTPMASAGFSGPSIVVAAPSGPARVVNLNVTVAAAVIGNRFDVERAVTRSVRRGLRIGGERVSP